MTAAGCAAVPHQAHAALPQDPGSVASPPLVEHRVRHVQRANKRRMSMRQLHCRRKGAFKGAAAMGGDGEVTHTGRGRVRAGQRKGLVEA
jgi:hypothetical protein